MVTQRLFLFSVFVASILLASSAAMALPDNARKDETGYYVSGQILVKAESGLSDSRFVNILAKYSAMVERRINGIGVSVVRVPPGLEKKIIDELNQDGNIEFAELDRLVPPGFVPNDPSFGSQWHHAKIGSATAWDSVSADGVIVAILDTGVNPTHVDLVSVLLTGWNVPSQNTDTQDHHGHGTAVAGAAAAAVNNGIGVAGVAKDAKILPVKITEATDGVASWSNIASGITWSANNGAKVVSNSYASYRGATVISAANYLKSKGGLMFSAAGNDGSECVVPENSAIMVISATTSSDVKASWSNYGDCIDVAAPGSSIYTTSNSGGYRSASGTSLATPVAAGLAALIYGVNQNFSSNDVENIMKISAHDLAGTDFDPKFGYGRIDAAAAAALAQTYQPTVTDTQAPTTLVTSPSSGATVNGIVTVTANASDNIGVTRVDLYVNGAFYSSDTQSPYAFSWDTTPLGNANATLAAHAYDAAGNKGVSSGVSVKVQNFTDVTPPIVSISNPAAGAKVTGVIAVTASATDDTGVQGIDLYIDGKKVSSATGANLSYNWNTKKVKAGSHTLKVLATDTSGNTAETAIVVYK